MNRIFNSIIIITALIIYLQTINFIDSALGVTNFQNSEKNKAITWFKNNISVETQDKFISKLEEAISKNIVCVRWLVSWSLTKSGKAYELYWRNGKFFIKEITIDEAQSKYGLKEGSIKTEETLSTISPDVFNELIEENNKEAILYHIESGFDVNSQYRYTTPLMVAANEGHIEIAKLLIEYGANINIYFFENMSPLLMAVSNNKIDIVRLFIKNDADVNIRPQLAHYNPLKDKYQRRRYPSNLIPYLNTYTALGVAAMENNLEMVRLLVENGADVNAFGYLARTPLVWAVIKIPRQKNSGCYTDIARFLLENGAEVDKSYTDAGSTGTTALMWAVFSNCIVDLIQLLIEYGADVNLKDNNNETALMMTENPDIIRILKRAGAK